MTPQFAAERKERGHSDIEEPELPLIKEAKLVARQFVAQRTAARCDRGRTNARDRGRCGTVAAKPHGLAAQRIKGRR